MLKFLRKSDVRIWDDSRDGSCESPCDSSAFGCCERSCDGFLGVSAIDQTSEFVAVLATPL